MPTVDLGPCECCGGRCFCGGHPLPSTITASITSLTASPSNPLPDYVPTALLGLEPGTSYSGQFYPDDCSYFLLAPLPNTVSGDTGPFDPCLSKGIIAFPSFTVLVQSVFGTGTYSPLVNVNFSAVGQVPSAVLTALPGECYAGEILVADNPFIWPPQFWHEIPAMQCGPAYSFDIELRCYLNGTSIQQLLDVFRLGVQVTLK